MLKSRIFAIFTVCLMAFVSNVALSNTNNTNATEDINSTIDKNTTNTSLISNHFNRVSKGPKFKPFLSYAVRDGSSPDAPVVAAVAGTPTISTDSMGSAIQFGIASETVEFGFSAHLYQLDSIYSSPNESFRINNIVFTNVSENDLLLEVRTGSYDLYAALAFLASETGNFFAKGALTGLKIGARFGPNSESVSGYRESEFSLTGSLGYKLKLPGGSSIVTTVRIFDTAGLYKDDITIGYAYYYGQ